MSQLISLICLVSMLLVLRHRKRQVRRQVRPHPGLLPITIGLAATCFLAAAYSVYHADDAAHPPIAAAILSNRAEQVAVTATQIKSRFARPQKLVFLFDQADSETAVTGLSQAFLKASGWDLKAEVERIDLHQRIDLHLRQTQGPAGVSFESTQISLGDFTAVLARHPGPVLFVSCCGLPARRETSDFWDQPRKSRFLVCEATCQDIDTRALENGQLIGWCIETSTDITKPRDFVLVDKTNATELAAKWPLFFTPSPE